LFDERRHSHQGGAKLRAGPGGLEGRWRVERVRGMLPPMLGVSKQIRGGTGRVRLGPLPGPSFRVEGKGERVVLVYHRPFAIVVDELEVGPEGEWSGRTLLGGCEIGRFRMTRAEQKGVAPSRLPSLQDDGTGEENAHEGVDVAR
jgi:hypothetical protein